jgi:predicted nucleic-acid-binding Zn-ribbon protein
MNELIKYTCPKCGNKEYESGEMWAVGSFWTRMFELHNRRFTFISCTRCRFTEFYKISRKNIGDLLNNNSM